ncbi:MAG: phosphate acyltransferase PlsX [Clostridiales bacterium]|nr:phosphate acyltransferase PlsX [Clostridiales bacterium]
MHIAVDAMGGDRGPGEIIEGVKTALTRHPELRVTVIGPMDVLRGALTEGIPDRLSLLHSPEVITTEEPPLVAIRRKKDSSLMLGINMLRDRQTDAFLSCGSTGAVMSGALFNVGRIRGVKRPALSPTLPTRTGKALLIDCGANADCKPEYLVQFGHMGAAYMQVVHGIKNPRVGLVNIGVEEEKGNELYREVHGLLKHSGLNFVGNIEARDVPAGGADVLVCDGFTGNILLKTMEGTASFIMGALKQELTRSALTKLAAALLRGGFIAIKKKMDYTEYGGAPLLGIDGCVIKAHGSSNAKAFSHAIEQAIAYIEGDVTRLISERLSTSPESGAR